MQNTFGRALWLAEGEVPAKYPWLSENKRCQVAVIGGGITGAFSAYYLAKAGIQTVLLTKEPIGYGSTSYGDGSLRYDLAMPLTQLSKKVGKDRAITLYRKCQESIERIEHLSQELSDFDFTRHDALYYTPDEAAKREMHCEFLVRKFSGFAVEYLDKEKAAKLFSFPLAAGILGDQLAGQVDPYRLTHALIKEAAAAGAQIYENTEASEMETSQEGISLTTGTGHHIYAERVVLATGFDTAKNIGRLSLRSRFFVATPPVETFHGYEKRCVARAEASNPFSLTTTADGRILISGQDSALVDGGGLTRVGRLRRLAQKRYDFLEHTLYELFPAIPELRAQFTYSAPYGLTPDGMPYIGLHSRCPQIYCALCPSDNAILFAEMAGRAFVALYRGEESPELTLFKEGREL